ncbi:hypothetical protein PVAP13_3NG271625 [Panicum virgatum]|uniref:Uncharacterized protein n=1 Tax=Panicum virgatum TaxID=38727 RepID=A0A8T0UIF4_PANVG|nr:hypothetical protein PVAP13_3NG271625 [Panicum virgatum]
MGFELLVAKYMHLPQILPPTLTHLFLCRAYGFEMNTLFRFFQFSYCFPSFSFLLVCGRGLVAFQFRLDLCMPEAQSPTCVSYPPLPLYPLHPFQETPDIM